MIRLIYVIAFIALGINGYGQACSITASGSTTIAEMSSLTFSLDPSCDDCRSCNAPNFWFITMPAGGSIEVAGTTYTMSPVTIPGSVNITILFNTSGAYGVNWEWGSSICSPSCPGGGATLSTGVTVSCTPAIACWNSITTCDGAPTVDLNTLLCATATPGGTWSGTGVTGSIFDPTGLAGAATITYAVGTAPCNATLVQNITITPGAGPTASNPLPISVVCNADIPLPDVSVVTDEADDNGPPTVAHVSDVSDGATCPEVITRTYSVSDYCGNSINVTQTITVDDNVDPTASNPAPLNVQCLADVPLADPAVVTDEADNCTVAPTVAFVSETSLDGACPKIITRTYSVTDDCGNSINVTQTITVNDDTDPTASNPAPINVQCSADVPAVDVEVVIDEADNCTAVPLVNFIGEVSDGGTCPEVITRTYRITDGCGNFILVSQTITVNDDTAPTASNPAPLAVECPIDAVPNVAAVIDEADNCTATPIVTFVSDVSDGGVCPTTITRTYRITDDCGNFTDVTQIVTIHDLTTPTASNPAPLNVQCLADAPVDVTVVTDEADNCTAVPMVAHVSDVSDGATCPEVITRTYSVTDGCGNSINVEQIITINDDIVPTASNPAPLNVQCLADAVIDITVVTDEADNCTAAPVVAFVSDVSDGATCPETITRTYSVTDDCGNTINVEQIITVNDDMVPTASNPAAINVQCIGDVPAFDIEVVTDEADNCTVAPVVAFVSDVSNGATCPETITRTYSVTDDCGNAITVDQLIIVNDDIAPTASNPAPLNVQCLADAVIDETVVTDEADNCTAIPVVAFVSDVSDGATCPETIIRTYSITDDCGNVTNVTQTITVLDDIVPTASNPAPINVQCIGDVPAVDVTVVIDEADNCTAAPVVAFVSEVTDAAACPETITRVYSVTDDCGNSIEVTQLIIVLDDIVPTASNPAIINVQCIGDVPAFDVAVVTDEADNCTAVPVVAFVSDVSDGATCPETITRTYSVTDDCGNAITVEQLIVVMDDIAPTASNPLPVNVQCIGDVPAIDIEVVTDEADNCTAVPVVSFVSDVSDGVTCPEVITRTYAVTDDCGNVLNVTQTITVNDDIDPTGTNPAGINVQCIGDVPAPDPTVVIDEADNCTAVPLVTFVSDVSDGATCPETITRTYAITDDCGNGITVEQLIIVNDDIDPTASNPLPLTVTCATNIPLPNAAAVTDAADNCGILSIDFISDVSDGAICSGEVVTRTYEITDACDNSINVTQLFTISTLIPPVSAGVDQTICEGESVTLTAENPSGAVITWDNAVLDGDPFTPAVGTITYTVEASLCAGVCTATDEVDVTVNPLPTVLFTVDTLLGCDPFTVNFTNLSTLTADCAWTFGDGSVAGDCGSQAHTYLSAGDFDVSLTVTSAEGCVNSDTYPGYISVINTPIAEFTPSTLLVEGFNLDVEFENTSSYADSYKWDFGDGTGIETTTEPTHTYNNEVEGVYQVMLVVSTTNPICRDTAYSVITVRDVILMYVPNAVTIDGNGFNNEFMPVIRAGIDYYDYHMTIFNRWGELIFESYNYDIGWNGEYGDQGVVEDGVYIWQIEYKETGSDERRDERGHVTVLK